MRFNYISTYRFSGLWLSCSYDIELDGYVRLSDQFIERLQKEQVLSALNKDENTTTILVPGAKEYIDKFINSRRISFRASKSVIENFIEYMSQKGSQRLVTVSKNIKNILKIEKGTNRRLKLADVEYLQKLKEIVAHALKQNSTTDLDKEILLLSIIESSNRLLYSISRNLLNAVVDGQKNILPKEDLQVVTETMYSDNIKHKKADFKYICKELKLCRPFPGYSDYFADLTSEILQMSDSKLHKILTKTIKAGQTKRDFFESVLGAHLAADIGILVQNTFGGDLSRARQVMAVFRGVISKRYTWISDKKQTLKVKTTAIRVLLDIIDKLYDTDGEEIVAMHFDMTVIALRDWEMGMRNDLETILFNIINYSVETLKHYIDTVSKNEIRILSQTIIYETYNITPEYDYLFYSGSKLTV